MPVIKKQMKITKYRKESRPQEDCEDLEEEIQQLEKQLQQKHNELFQLQRNSYRRKLSPIQKRPETFVRPQEIILSSSVDKLKKGLDLMSMLTGMEVHSYVAGDHCCIVYHIQYDSLNEVKHGLRIDMQGGVNKVTDSFLPLGFRYEAVTAEFDNIMTPACLGGIRKALVAYYSRNQQFEKLKRLVNMDAELSKTLDSSHIELSFYAKNQLQEEAEIKIVLMLDYRIYDITPKSITFEEIDLPVDAIETLNTQCVIFKRKPLHKAFKEAFIEGVGTYIMERPLGVQTAQQQPQSRRLVRPNHANYNDDTFRPEDYSDQSDDDN